MKAISKIGLYAALLGFWISNLSGQNVFLDRNYWKQHPNLEQVKKDISAGHDPVELNRNAFDAIVYALLENADNEVIQYLMQVPGNDANKMTHDGRTYVFWAAYKGNLDMMQYCIDQGGRMDLVDDHGYSVLNFAANAGIQDPRVYDFCLENGSNPTIEKTKSGANALLLISPALSDFTMLDYFVSKGVDLHSTDSYGRNVWHYAVKGGNQQVLNQLINRGFDPKAKDQLEGNAFIPASQGRRGHQNNLEFYHYLASLGLDPALANRNGENALHAIARQSKDSDIVQFFLDQGTDVNQVNEDGNTPFILAAQRNQLAIIKQLSPHIKDVNKPNKDGQTALMLAVRDNSPEVVSYLMTLGGTVAHTDNKGNNTAGYLFEGYRSASANQFEQKFKWLTKAGLNLEASQENGNTLWHIAVKKNEPYLIDRLDKAKSIINKKNNDGITPLHLAAMKATNIEMLKALLDRGANKQILTDFDESALDLAKENELLSSQEALLNFLK